VDVFLTSESFTGIIASVIEGFKYEVIGLLLGDWYPTAGKVVIWQAHPIQLAKRGYSHVIPSSRRKRLEDVWDILTPHWLLGYFHSHTEREGREPPTPELSVGDEEAMKEDESLIEVIVAVRKAKRRNQMRYIHKEKHISGAVGEYHLEIAAWHLDDEGEVQEAELWCPYIHIINASYRLGLTRSPGRLFTPSPTYPPRLLRKLREQVKNYERKIINRRDEKAGDEILSEIEQILTEIASYNS